MTKQEPTDLGFHDDELIGLELDLAKKTATVTIKTFSWSKCSGCPKPPEDPKASVICAKPDKIVKIFMELDDKAEDSIYDIELKQTLPESILWAYAANNSIDITLIQGYLTFKVKSWRKEEQR
jgi:hypothetical protein